MTYRLPISTKHRCLVVLGVSSARIGVRICSCCRCPLVCSCCSCSLCIQVCCRSSVFVAVLACILLGFVGLSWDPTQLLCSSICLCRELLVGPNAISVFVVVKSNLLCQVIGLDSASRVLLLIQSTHGSIQSKTDLLMTFLHDSAWFCMEKLKKTQF